MITTESKNGFDFQDLSILTIDIMQKCSSKRKLAYDILFGRVPTKLVDSVFRNVSSKS